VPDRPNIARLIDEAVVCCEALGLPRELIPNIYRSGTDWEFIIKIDALLEASIKEVIHRSLKLEVNGNLVGDNAINKFVSNLPVNGRTSLSTLLAATGCDKDICDFIETTRSLRNSFAHKIENVGASLLSVIRKKDDWKTTLKRLAPIENYDEDEWISVVKRTKICCDFQFSTIR